MIDFQNIQIRLWPPQRLRDRRDTTGVEAIRPCRPCLPNLVPDAFHSRSTQVSLRRCIPLSRSTQTHTQELSLSLFDLNYIRVLTGAYPYLRSSLVDERTLLLAELNLAGAARTRALAGEGHDRADRHAAAATLGAETGTLVREDLDGRVEAWPGDVRGAVAPDEGQGEEGEGEPEEEERVDGPFCIVSLSANCGGKLTARAGKGEGREDHRERKDEDVRHGADEKGASVRERGNGTAPGDVRSSDEVVSILRVSMLLREVGKLTWRSPSKKLFLT